MSRPAKVLRVALVSTGLGRVLRGFESFTESLFQALRKQAPHIDLTLFQGGGKSGERRVIVPNCHRDDIPAQWFGYEKGNLLEKRSFAVFLYPRLRRGAYDIVHYNELVMGSALFHLRHYFGGKFRLLYCNGAPSPPIHYYHRCDFAQMLTGPMYKEACAFGMPRKRLFLVPYGVDVQRFSPEKRVHRAETRRELGIPQDAEVILTVAALNQEHKRIDYVIKEVASLDRHVWLVAAGQRTNETTSLEQEANRLLGERWRFVSWPHERVHLLYGATDVFVLGSLTEGLPNTLLEAMASGLSIVTHNGPLYQWVLGESNARKVDMAQRGALTNAIHEIIANPSDSDARGKAVRRFSWETLIPEYQKMYDEIAGDGGN